MGLSITARGRSRPAFWRKLERDRKVADNGDSFFVGEGPVPFPPLGDLSSLLVSVADGLGGEGNDDLASQAAVGALAAAFRLQSELPAVTTPDGWLREAYVNANNRVCQERGERGVQGMFTTLTTALITLPEAGPCTFYPANIGDSRMYLARDGALSLVTRDDGANSFVTRVIGDPHVFSDSWLRYTTTVGRMPDIDAKLKAAIGQRVQELLPDLRTMELGEFTELFQNVLEGVYPLELLGSINVRTGFLLDRIGTDRFLELIDLVAEAYQPLASELAGIPLQAGDRLFLCSDGISNAFSHAFLADALSATGAGQPPRETLDNILKFLLEAPGRVDDDRTAVIVQVS